LCGSFDFLKLFSDFDEMLYEKLEKIHFARKFIQTEDAKDYICDWEGGRNRRL
jgi:hypothetical protein